MRTLFVPDKISIISRREIIPLLAKARQILKHYNTAMGCPSAVLDSSGKAVKTPGILTETCQGASSGYDSKKQMRHCEFCIKHFHGFSHTCRGSECPCGKTHRAALAESRRTEGVYVYSCAAGFVFWTSPLYRNGRYVGALTAGQVILSESSLVRLAGNNMVLEKLRDLCNEENTVQKFSAIIENIPKKNHDEIKALAEMLGVCAEEISERKEEPCQMIRRKAWQNMTAKNAIEPLKTVFKKGRPSDLEYTQEGKSGTDGLRRGFLEKERMLIAAFRRGDNETGSRILKELMGQILAAMPGNMEVVRFRAIELVVLLSRAAISDTDGGDAGGEVRPLAAGDALLEINNRYFTRMLEAKSAEEIIEILHLSAERMASKIFSFQGMRHASALRKAERYIWENYTRKLSLKEIAKASGLSAPYFSTIFKEEMGENLSSYLNRLRVARTVTLLTETGKSLNEIAKLCGFEDQSWFSKIFKSFTGMSPGKFRENGGGTFQCDPGKDQEKDGITTFWPSSAGHAWQRTPDWNKQEMLSS